MCRPPYDRKDLYCSYIDFLNAKRDHGLRDFLRSHRDTRQLQCQLVLQVIELYKDWARSYFSLTHQRLTLDQAATYLQAQHHKLHPYHYS